MGSTASRSAVNPRQAAMEKLAAYFPLGAAKDRTAMYLGHRAVAQVDTRDLAEAVERLSVTRAEKSFPALAVMLRVCHEAADDRRRADFSNRQEDDRQSRRPLSTDELDQCRILRDLGKRGVTWCDVCHDFTQAEKGDNGGWRSCHYSECVEIWRQGRRDRVTREQIHRGWERFGGEAVPARVTDEVAGFSSLGDELGGMF